MSSILASLADNIYWILFFAVVAAIFAIFFFRERFFRAHIYMRQHAVEITIFCLIALFLCVFFARDMFITIPSGEVGVLWERFNGGTQVCHAPLDEGFHVIMPWNKIYVYDLRVQVRDQKLDVLSSDGLNLEIDVVYRFELLKQNIPILHKFVGPDYINTLIGPEVAADARNIFGLSTPEEIYAGRRDKIQNDIKLAVNANLRKGFNPSPGQITDCGRKTDVSTAPVATPSPTSTPVAAPLVKAANASPAAAPLPSPSPSPSPTPSPEPSPIQYVFVEDVLARSITLPPAVEAAINSKNQEQQRNEEYEYRILREEKEATRKRVEAAGIKDFITTIAGPNHGFDDGYLRWLGIQATLDLAKSPNAKVVIIGDGKGGLPVILGDSGASASPVAVSKAAPGAPVTLQSPPIANLQQQLDAGAAGLADSTPPGQ